jgi:putative membrane protein
MNIRAKDFFSKAEKERIRESVRAAESQTSGEIAVMLVDESDRYREAGVAGTIAIAGLASTIIALILDHVVASSWGLGPDPHYTSIWFWIPVTVILLLPAWYLFKAFPHLKLALVGRKRVESAVRERSLLSFYRKGLHRTRNQTGILIFISLLERKVRIMGDRGIHAKIGQSYWNARAGELVKGVREGRALDALTEVISKCGVELATHFPSGTDNPDEVPDDIIC